MRFEFDLPNIFPPLEHYRLLFEASPTPYLVLSPKFVIVAVSDSFLRATLTERIAILGRSFFDVFPDNPSDPKASGSINLRRSLERVVSSGKPDRMPIQRYDIAVSGKEELGFETRYWSPLNTPVLDDATGGLLYIIHRVEDVSELMAGMESVAERSTDFMASGKIEELIPAEHLRKANDQIELIEALVHAHRVSYAKAEIAEKTASLAINAQHRGEAWLEGIISSAMDAILSVNENQEIVLFNKAAETMFQCSAEEALGGTLDRFIPQEFRGSHRHHIERFGQEGTTSRSMQSPGVLTALRTNGERFPIEATISLVKIGDEKLFTVLIRDITERLKAEEALRESENRFRSMYENAAVGVEQVSMSGELLMVNSAICRMLGYAPEELKQLSFEQITHLEDRQRERELLDKLLRGETEFYEIEKRYLRKDGTPIWVNVTSSVVEDAAGKQLYRISIIQDISERKKAEDRLQQVQKMEAIGRLSGGIAHDFNTLLNIILGFAELTLADSPPDDAGRYRIEQIVNAAKTGASLTKQLLAFSRKQPVVARMVDLRKVTEDLQPMLRRLLPENIELLLYLSEDLCPVKADLGQLQQLLLNLATNARDAMAKGGSLTVEVRPVELDEGYVQQHPMVSAGRYVMLAVTDTGVGMDADTASRIFEPFFTTKATGNGTGLGLATVYGIVKQSGGDIWAYSEPEIGTIFKVYLPLIEGETLVEEIAEAVPVKLTGTETVLIVEDSPPLRELTRELLGAQGYKVLTAEDGVQALALSLEYQDRIDLLVTDIVMPHMGGIELAERLTEQRPEMAVVYVSGYTEEALSRNQNLSRVRILEKPHTMETLFRTVRQSLDENRVRE